MNKDTDSLKAALADRYKIERHLGEGGMATVYLAEDLKHHRKVAVKVLRPELAAVLGADRFVQEITTTANLQHPHILPLFDSGDADGFLYYVMPFIDGETLRDKLNRETQLGIDEAVKITTEVADALEYAHGNDVIHRDIKPENILLHNGRPMIADFGIALAVSAAAGGRMTETGLSLGTPHYMSPEQATGEKDITARSDVYSLASVLYEMLTGHPPHAGATAQQIIMRIVTDDARPLSELRKSVPPHVTAAVAKALEKLAADRFGSAAAFAAALGDTAFTWSGTVAPQAGVAQAVTGRGFSWKHLATVGGVFLLLGWAVGVFGGSETAPVPGPTVLTLDPGVDELFRFARIGISRDGRTFVIAWRDGRDSPLYVRRADELDFRPLPGTEGADDPTFGPDGEWIAYIEGSEHTLWKVAVSGGRPIRLFTDDIEAVQPHWGDDGTIVFQTAGDMYLVSGSGGVPERVSERLGFSPHLLPDGSGVLYGRRGGGIGLLDLATDSTNMLIEQGSNPTYLESGHILFTLDRVRFLVPFDLASRTITGDRIPVMYDMEAALYHAVSASGTLIFRSGMRFDRLLPQVELVRVFFDGGVDTLRLAPRGIQKIRISPDGRRLVYSELRGGDNHLYLYDFELGGPTQLTFEHEGHDAVWSPEGSRIAFVSDREGSDLDDVYVMPADGSGGAELLLTRPGNQFVEDWAKDGTIAFNEPDNRLASRDLWTMRAAGGEEPQPFLATEWSETHLTVSPDGQWAAYRSNETGSSEVYVRRFPSGVGQRRVSTGGGLMPRWAPDGETIFFLRNTTADTIFAARVLFEPSFLVRETDAVYTNPAIGGFDVHPDGTHLVVQVRQPRVTPVDEEQAEASRVVVVLNWFEELRERLGNE
jgi:serine/threonine-protein kinase